MPKIGSKTWPGGDWEGLLHHRVTCIISLVVLNCTRAQICKPFKKSTGNDSQPGGPVRQSYLTYRPARLHRLAESITGLIKVLQIRALVLSRTAEGLILTAVLNYMYNVHLHVLDCPRSDCSSPWPRSCLLCHNWYVSTHFLRFNLSESQFQLSLTSYSSLPSAIIH
jgi:hypothetical protein